MSDKYVVWAVFYEDRCKEIEIFSSENIAARFIMENNHIGAHTIPFIVDNKATKE